MATFDRDAPSSCPQCANAAGFVYCANTPPAAECVDVRGAAPNTAHMHRACFTCTFEWAEDPVV